VEKNNQSDDLTTMQDLLAQVKEVSHAIEKIKEEASASALDIAESQTKASTELSSIISAQDEIEKLLELIKNHSVEASSLHKENQDLASKLEVLTNAVTSYEQKASIAATSSETSKTEILSILSEVTNSKNNASSFAEAAKKNDAETQAILAQVTASRDAVLNLHDKAKTDSKNIESISATATEADGRVLQYEEELTELQKRYEEINDRIEKLLPGATSVGLAKAFKERKDSLAPQIYWARKIFLGAIVGFIILGIYGLGVEKITTISQFFIFVFERSPLIAGLVLLEEFGRRLYNHTLRLEEDYAYKQTMSLSFDGYKKALADIDANEPPKPADGSETLTKTLSSNVLGTLNERPGRIYEDKEKEKDINIDTVIKTLNPTGDEAAGQVFLKLYGDLSKNFKGSALKALVVIILVATIGIGAGYYFGHSNNKEVKASPNFNIGANPSKIGPAFSHVSVKDSDKLTTEKETMPPKQDKNQGAKGQNEPQP